MTGSDEFPFFAGKRAVVYHEKHGDGRLVDGDEGKLFDTVVRTDGLADVDLIDAGNGDDVAHFRRFHFDPL